MVLEMSDEEFIAKLREEAGTKDARIKELEERLKAQWSEAAVVAIEKESRASYLPSTLSFAERAELVFFQRGQREAACRILTNEAERRVRELEETLDHIACDHHQLHERIKELEGQICDAYAQGKRDGITLYAHWKDGVQYVGTCGRTLSEALAEEGG
jgi:hypothetical protein